MLPIVADNILWPIGWVLWLHLAAWYVGRLVTSRILHGVTPDSRPAARTVIEFAVGLTVLAHAALLLGVAHLLYREVLLAAGAVLGGLGAREVFRCTRGRMTELRPRIEDAPLILAVVFFATFLPYSLDPTLAHDDNVYHVLLPRTYLAEHAIAPLPVNLYANMPHLIEVLYTWPLATWELTTPKVAVFSWHFWIIAGLVAGAAPHAGRFGAGLVALLYVSGKNVQWHTETAYVEPAIGLLLLAAALASLAWFETKHSGYLTVAGLMCGAAFASKYTGWFFGTAILLPLLVGVVRAPVRSTLRVTGVLRLVAIPALMVAPWLIKNTVVTGNPIYPNLYQFLGGRFWSEVQQFHYLRSQSYSGGPEGYLESFLWIPINLTLKDNFFYCPSFSAALMALFLIALVLPGSWRPPARHLMVMAGIGLLCWAFSVRQGRFLVAWVPVMALAASFALAPIRRSKFALFVVTMFVIGAGVWQLHTQRYSYAPPAVTLTSQRPSFVTGNLNYRVCEFLNEAVPADGKVLALWDNRFFFLEREFYADSVYEAPTVLAWLRASPSVEAFTDELRARRVSHVVINERVMNTYLNNTLVFDLIDDVRYPAQQLAADRALVQQFTSRLEEVHRVGSFVVYQIGPLQ